MASIGNTGVSQLRERFENISLDESHRVENEKSPVQQPDGGSATAEKVDAAVQQSLLSEKEILAEIKALEQKMLSDLLKVLVYELAAIYKKDPPHQLSVADRVEKTIREACGDFKGDWEERFLGPAPSKYMREWKHLKDYAFVAWKSKIEEERDQLSGAMRALESDALKDPNAAVRLKELKERDHALQEKEKQIFDRQLDELRH
jgi:hypothetical protein